MHGARRLLPRRRPEAKRQPHLRDGGARHQERALRSDRQRGSVATPRPERRESGGVVGQEHCGGVSTYRCSDAPVGPRDANCGFRCWEFAEASL